jgi:hypothetical protein
VCRAEYPGLSHEPHERQGADEVPSVADDQVLGKLDHIGLLLIQCSRDQSGVSRVELRATHKYLDQTA